MTTILSVGVAVLIVVVLYLIGKIRLANSIIADFVRILDDLGQKIPGTGAERFRRNQKGGRNEEPAN
jgi:hypothetical protein